MARALPSPAMAWVRRGELPRRLHACLLGLRQASHPASASSSSSSSSSRAPAAVAAPALGRPPLLSRPRGLAATAASPASTARPCATLPWKAAKAQAEPLAEYFFDDDNVLSLYAIQRALLTPKVEEQAQLRAGLQHVEISWRLDGAAHRGSGAARSRRAARREAARRLLRGLPLSDALVAQMRKQMINSLRLRLGAHVLEDGPASSAGRRDAQGEALHRTTWRVPRPGGQAPLELAAEGLGGSAAEAQASAWERLYREAVRLRLLDGAEDARRDALQEETRRGLREAEAERRAQLEAAATCLSPEAAGELAARHNAVVQRHRVEARVSFVAHRTGFHCSLTWNWRDGSGTPQARIASGVGASKRAARGEAMRAMLVAQGYAEDLGAEVLNEAARIRGLAKAGSAAAVPAAAAWLKGAPPGSWGLALPEVWQLALARGDEPLAAQLGEAMLRQLQACEDRGLPPSLWEQLLDACALAAHGDGARQGLAALGQLPLRPGSFPSSVHRDYFQHFRSLAAWERVGANQAAVSELLERGSDAGGVRLEREQCILPYLTLGARGDAALELAAADVRAGDVVFLRPAADEGRGASHGHLAAVTSVTAAEQAARDGKCKLTLRCSTLSGEDLDASSFLVHGLDSEVSAMRMVAALQALARPGPQQREDAAAPRGLAFEPSLALLLLQSFHAAGLGLARSASEEIPPGCQWSDPQGLERCLAAATGAAASRGYPLTPAQTAAVRSSLERRLTLIHGPPGTGKTTAAVCVVLAWRPLGEKILCAADSNVAADQLHAGLARWGVRALRFSFGEPQRPEEQAPEGARSRRSRRSPGRGGERGGQSSASQRFLAMRDAIAEHQIVVTTCNSAGHELLAGTSFPRVLVDECTQSVEPSTLIPLSHGCAHLVLIGDHRQLPPTVVAPEARRGGLERSLFARLAGSGSSRPAEGDEAEAAGRSAGAVVEPVLLDEQRRMHPSIAAFPNAHFYDGRVRDAAPDRPPVPGLPWPQEGAHRVLLVDVSAEAEAEERRGTSLRNAVEAEALPDLLLRALRPSAGDLSRGLLGGAAAPLAPEEVAVVTPYVEQKQALQARLAKLAATSPAAAPLARVRVATVDGFQGAESDLVVFSAVRSNREGRLGFVGDERRANVLLTRARRGLLVLADAATMRRAEGSVWARWLAWAEAEGAVVPLEELVPRAKLGASDAGARERPADRGAGAC